MQEEMLIPTIKLQRKRHHKEFEKWRREAVEANANEEQKNFQKKGKGQWNLMRNMEKEDKANL